MHIVYVIACLFMYEGMKMNVILVFVFGSLVSGAVAPKSKVVKRDGLLGGLLGGNEGEGGLLGLNLSGTLGSILGKSDDPAKAAKTGAFFDDLHKLLSNILTDSTDTADNKYLARALVNKIRGGGFCDLKTGNSYGTEFGNVIVRVAFANVINMFSFPAGLVNQ